MKWIIVTLLAIANTAAAQTDYRAAEYYPDSVTKPQVINLHIQRAERLERTAFIMQAVAVLSLTAIQYTYQAGQSMVVFTIPLGIIAGSFIIGGMANREYRAGYQELGLDY